MTFLELKPLTAEQLTAAWELDQLCFGGLWTKSGYERELDSPNSQLLILQLHHQESPLTAISEEIRQRAEGRGQKAPREEDLSLFLPFLGSGNRRPLGGSQETTKSTSLTIPPILGLGCFWSILEEAHITILAIHPDWRRQGLGQLLLYALLKDATRRQLEWATLEVKPSNQAALSLYHKFGFMEAGRRRRYYQDTGEDALILWRSGLQTPEFTETLTNCYQQLQPRLAYWNLDWKNWQD